MCPHHGRGSLRDRSLIRAENGVNEIGSLDFQIRTPVFFSPHAYRNHSPRVLHPGRSALFCPRHLSAHGSLLLGRLKGKTLPSRKHPRAEPRVFSLFCAPVSVRAHHSKRHPTSAKQVTKRPLKGSNCPQDPRPTPYNKVVKGHSSSKFSLKKGLSILVPAAKTA